MPSSNNARAQSGPAQPAPSAGGVKSELALIDDHGGPSGSATDAAVIQAQAVPRSDRCDRTAVCSRRLARQPVVAQAAMSQGLLLWLIPRPSRSSTRSPPWRRGGRKFVEAGLLKTRSGSGAASASGDKHIGGEDRADTCLRARAGIYRCGRRRGCGLRERPRLGSCVASSSLPLRVTVSGGRAVALCGRAVAIYVRACSQRASHWNQRMPIPANTTM